ncbi:hypothetical protein ACYPKM_00370 [Pseudomonas aeruginosa]
MYCLKRDNELDHYGFSLPADVRREFDYQIFHGFDCDGARKTTVDINTLDYAPEELLIRLIGDRVVVIAEPFDTSRLISGPHAMQRLGIERSEFERLYRCLGSRPLGSLSQEEFMLFVRKTFSLNGELREICESILDCASSILVERREAGLSVFSYPWIRCFISLDQLVSYASSSDGSQSIKEKIENYLRKLQSVNVAEGVYKDQSGGIEQEHSYAQMCINEYLMRMEDAVRLPPIATKRVEQPVPRCSKIRIKGVRSVTADFKPGSLRITAEHHTPNPVLIPIQVT